MTSDEGPLPGGEGTSVHVRWLRQYARGARRAAQSQSGAQRARSEEMAERLLAAAAALTGFRFADYARVGEVAERLGIHVESARRLMRKGTLPAERVGGRWLVRREELEAFAKEYKWGGRERWWEPEPVVKRPRKLGEDSERTVRGWMKVGLTTDGRGAGG